jgi:hypothetical protein
MFRIWPLYTPFPNTPSLLADISRSMPKLPARILPPTSRQSPGHFLSLALRVPFFHTRPGTHAHAQNYQINACMFDSLQILFTSGILFLMCAGTWSSYINATPSGI